MSLLFDKFYAGYRQPNATLHFSHPGLGTCHIKRWPSDDPVRRVEVLDLTYVKKGRGRPKKTWLENIRNDLSLLDLNENLTFNRTQWKKKIHVTDPT